MLKASIGFRAHSGWAAAVAVARDAAVDRRRLEICDCLTAGSAQPYHAAARMPLRDAEAYLEQCAAASRAMAESAIRKFVEALAAQGYRVSGAAILLGAGRPPGELAKTLASHPMIHTAEGEFYRQAIREACRRCALPLTGIPEQSLCPRLDQVAALGKPLGPPWGRDQKLCALAALQCLPRT